MRALNTYNTRERRNANKFTTKWKKEELKEKKSKLKKTRECKNTKH